MKSKLSLLNFVFAFVILFSGCVETKKTAPNFIIFFADDMGYGDLSCYGNPVISTPNIDMLASEGIKFTQFCVASSVCTPSRGALLTGRYPVRYGLAKGVLKPFSTYGLPDKEITIAEYLKTKDYTTACIGKWHLGIVDGSLPNDQGFDYFYGLPFSNDMSHKEQEIMGNSSYEYMLPVMEQKDTLELDPDQSLMTKKLTIKAFAWLEENRDKPFFIYFAHPMPHIPLYASKDFKGKSRRGKYGDAVSEIDWSVGQIVAKIKEYGLDDNTVIIFTSDNGPWLQYGLDGGSAGLLRAGKGTTYEGGHRVPFILWGPGVFNKKGVERNFVSSLDVFPTIQGIEGDKMIMVGLDGRDLSKCLINDSAFVDKPFFYYSKDGELEGVRYGSYKLLLKENSSELYQLEHDPAEKYNLASKDSLIVNELKTLMINFERSLKR